MIVGLDIGTNNIRVVIADVNPDGSVEIKGTACNKSAGVRNGVIVNIDDAKNVIRDTIESAEQEAMIEVHSCIASVGGAQIEGFPSRGIGGIGKSSKPKEIRAEDIERVIESATAVKVPLDRDKLHVIPQKFAVDETDNISEPLGMIGVRLETEVYIITASRTINQNISESITRAGYSLGGIMLKTLASSHAVVHKDEFDLGSIVIDLGAGSTDILVVYNGGPVCTASIPVGGNLVTNDIHLVKGIPFNEAERIKIESGSCYLPNVDPNATVIIPGVGGRAPEEILQTELCDIIMPRMEEIFYMVRETIVNKTNVSELNGNIILVGGGANMDGVRELCQKVFDTSAVKIGRPFELGGKTEECRSPEWATAVGLVVTNKNTVNKKEHLRKRSVSEKNNSLDKKESLLKKFAKKFF